MGEDRLVAAAGVLEGVGEDGQLVETTIVKDKAGKVVNETGLPFEPGGVDDGRTEGVAEKLSEQFRLSGSVFTAL
jgi:hypothetical protein